MLFAHITDDTADVSVESTLLRSFHVPLNNTKLTSRFVYTSKAVRPISDRFPNEESSLDADDKQMSLTVELKPDKRQVRLNKAGKISFSNKNSLASDDKKGDDTAEGLRRRQWIETTQSYLPLKQEEAESMLKASDKGTSAAPQALPVHSTHRVRKKRKHSSVGMQETWDLLERTYRQSRSQQTNDKASVHSVGKPSTATVRGEGRHTEIPVEQARDENRPADPRLRRTQRDTENTSMDLPLPKFGRDAAVALSARRIDVVMGFGRVAAAAGDEDGVTRGSRMMESLPMSLLDVLDDGEFEQLRQEFQRCISAALRNHHSTHLSE